VNQSLSHPVSELLVRWKAGDPEALEALVPLVYKDLRGIARRHLRRERPGHTLQSAALVHEAYLRLLDQRPFDTENRVHFLAVASRLMRQILVDYARGHGAANRGADRIVDLETSLVLPQMQSTDVVALDDALKDLTRLDQRQGQIVELRFFGGLATEEIAEVLDISPSTVKREWNVAKAWLTRQMKKGKHGDPGTVAKN
jgi:RNA polymerase sigma-70 factor (ECF subfamily)